MNILKKQVAVVGLYLTLSLAACVPALVSKADPEELVSAPVMEDWAFVLEGEAATLERCLQAGDLLRHIVVLREGGWTQAEVDELVENEETRSLIDLVFRLNQKGLNRSDDLAESLTDLCTAQLRLAAQ